MRIAVSGTHFSEKSTLIAALIKEFPNFTWVEEPYILLKEEGYEFSNPPSVEDFEQQLEFVDKNLQEILLNESLGILKDVEVVEVVGNVEKRVRMIKAEFDRLKKVFRIKTNFKPSLNRYALIGTD